MFQLSEQQAQDIVDKMMKDIPYNINIMNDQGVIIGSGNKGRVGTIHQGAVKALATGKMIEVWDDGRFEKKGTNEPIVIDHKRVGVIGITGNPNEVRPFCNIVRTTVALLIEQGTALKNLAHEANRKKAFLEMLLQHQGAYSQKLKKEASTYKIDLLLKTVVLYVKNFTWNEESAKSLLLYPSFVMEEDTHLIMVQNAKSTDKLIQTMLQHQNDALIAIGNLKSSIAESYYQAKSAMNVLVALNLPSRVVAYDEVDFLVKLSHADLSNNLNVVSKLEDTMDMMETLRSFINHDCSVSLTAAELNIHRNTLQYRLKRIHSITGKDPRNVLQLFELTHGLLSLYK
ncbi:sugar diacid utilization regulator [Paenibacillus selenitireducens]|uniref:Sugar diacid utilization regulator n=1 Tax=Paenibacillus selenitireducens TaxID=1324314 RepID=A0A1T2XH41_9BACL|nr:sugar diacid recognition domain-containing protein [Paenibacillus selenitireducens]OPA79207.1 sugar diacid utilization regulator [Paenibacillus selenitireducens]